MTSQKENKKRSRCFGFRTTRGLFVKKEALNLLMRGLELPQAEKLSEKTKAAVSFPFSVYLQKCFLFFSVLSDVV